MLDIEKIKCLIVDDNSKNRIILKNFLNNIKINNISFAENGKAVYEKLNLTIINPQQQFNLVILDWGLPDINGHSILQQCRSDQIYDNMSFIMILDEANKEQAIKAIKAGATAYIHKPFTEDDFREKVVKALHWLATK